MKKRSLMKAMRARNLVRYEKTVTHEDDESPKSY
ncbi:hypothetical protein F4694_003382 [Bacillus niacini]|uniref:Uncharacterized protein n=1 Tax=Neobacillus niacini TaxID=86668 RepID=A0A852TCT5_9BACI|nr:hypothetical protein [Neobacillus niacini]